MNEIANQIVIVEALNIMDDTFFQKIAEDPEVCEEMLRVFLDNPDLKIISSQPQCFLRNAGTRSVILDAFCTDKSGVFYNVELQKSDCDNHQKRVRYNASNIDTSVTEKGIPFSEIPDVYAIYLSKFDVFKEGKTVYHIDRTIRETGTVVDNGFYEIYANAAVDDGSKTAELMQYIKNTNEDKPEFPKTSKRVKYFKEEEGKEEMCEIIEKYAEERATKAADEAAKEADRSAACEFLKNGASLEMVLKSLKRLTEEEIASIYKDVMEKKL